MIYFHMPSPGVLVLLLVYAKNETENLTNDDLKAIRAAIAEVRDAVGNDPEG